MVAELLVVMARVPKSEGHRGGISAFVVEADSPGITVERRNKFMGLRGIENGVTRLHRVRVPSRKPDRPGRRRSEDRADHTQRRTAVDYPRARRGSSKWSLKIAREWSGERVQWGKPLGKHEAVASKISFIAATNYALDAVLELSASDGRRRSQRHPDRGGVGQIVVQRDGLPYRRRAGADPRWPGLRDRGVPGRARGACGTRRSRWCGTCGSTASSKGPARS